MPKDCGACNLCCTVLQVADIGKPAGMTCWNTCVHGGCKVQAEKATREDLRACADFECIWLQSQSRGSDAWARSSRPDQIHVMFWTPDRQNPSLLFANVDTRFPNAWREPLPMRYIEEMNARGVTVEIIVGDRRHRMPDSPGETYAS